MSMRAIAPLWHENAGWEAHGHIRRSISTIIRSIRKLLLFSAVDGFGAETSILAAPVVMIRDAAERVSHKSIAREEGPCA